MGSRHTIMAPMDMPPPLEDCSEQVGVARKRREAREQEEERQKEWQRMQAASQQQPTPPTHEAEDAPGPGEAILKGGKVAREAKEAKERDSNETRAKGTCGCKKGFFAAAKPKKKATKKPSDEIEVLRPKEKPKPKGYIEGFEMPSIDVTASQVSSVLDMKDVPADQWMSPELLQAIAQEPELLMGFQDPEIQNLMAEVAKDPKAIEKHAGNKKLMKFYEKYIKLASAHFSKPK